MESGDKKGKREFIKIPIEVVEDIIEGMVEIELPESINPPDDNIDKEYRKSSPFIMIREVLTRIGYLKDNKIYQTVHILQKKKKYYLAHFKQLIALDGLESSYNEKDKKRLHKVASLLSKWGMVKLINPAIIDGLEEDPDRNIFINIVSVEKIKSGEVERVKKYSL